MSPGRLFLSSVFEKAKELKLKPSQRLVLTALFKYLGRKDFCWPTQRKLAEDTGLCLRQIRRILDDLANMGVIKRDKRLTTGRARGNNAYEYRFALSQSFETKGDISDQTKADICDSQSGHFEHTKADIRDSQSGHLRHSKVPKRQASRKRAGVEYIRGIDQRNISSTSSGREEDAIINKQISKMQKQAEVKADGRGNSNGGKESVSPKTKGEIVIPPPDPPDDLLLKIYGRVPPDIEFLSAPMKSVDLHPYLRPFKNEKELSKFFSKEEIRAMNTPGPMALEAKCADFVKRVLEDHFVEEVRGGIRVMAMRAVRSGFLNRCGFRNFCERGLPDGYAESRPYGRDPHEEVEWEKW